MLPEASYLLACRDAVMMGAELPISRYDAYFVSGEGHYKIKTSRGIKSREAPRKFSSLINFTKHLYNADVRIILGPSRARPIWGLGAAVAALGLCSC